MLGKIYKIILLGDPQVGKTSIRRSYFGESFNSQCIATLGADFAVKKVEQNSVQIWDIGGQPSFAMLHKQYFIGAHGAIVAFDVTNYDTLKNLQYWLQRIEEEFTFIIPTLIVANKIDLLTKDELDVYEAVVQEEVDNLSKYYQQQFTYIKTSALTGENIDDAFEKLIKNIHQLAKK